MYQNTVIPARCAPPAPESSLCNRSCKSYTKLDSQFTMRCPGMTKRGFTLIELLVVVLIIGIFSAVALPQYTKAVEKSRLFSYVPFAKTLKEAAEVYYMANGQYPVSFADLDVNVPAGCKEFQEGNYYRCGERVMLDLYDNGERDVSVALLTSTGGRIAKYKFYLKNGSINGGRTRCKGYSDVGNLICRSVCGEDDCWIE